MMVSVTSLSYGLLTSVYNTVGMKHCIMRVYQRQHRLGFLIIVECGLVMGGTNCTNNIPQSQYRRGHSTLHYYLEP